MIRATPAPNTRMYRCNNGAIESALFLDIAKCPFDAQGKEKVWAMQMSFGQINIPATNEWRLTPKAAFADYIAHQERALHQHEATARFYMGLVDNLKASLVRARMNMEPNVPQNPNCDGGYCEKSEGPVRVLPTGHGNAILCFACYLNEMTYRRGQIRDGIDYDLPTWDSLKVYVAE